MAPTDNAGARPPLAQRLDLEPHPEGGWFRQTWRSAVSFEPAGYGGPRRAATAIYFLLHPGERSRWHVVRSDELWLWHSGGPLELRTGGSGSAPHAAGHPVLLGSDLSAWQQPQVLIPGGTWQCAGAGRAAARPGQLRSGARLRVRGFPPRRRRYREASGTRLNAAAAKSAASRCQARACRIMVCSPPAMLTVVTSVTVRASSAKAQV